MEIERRRGERKRTAKTMVKEGKKKDFRMGEECRYCNKWKEQCIKFEEHFYWDHVDARMMHFSKSMTGDFSKCMIIPRKFIEHFTGELLETVELKVPSGDIWHVELKKTKEGVVLDCGWKSFIEAYCIQENDTLMFNYNGSSSFLVLMFEQSGCEKAISHCAKRRDHMDNLRVTPSSKMAKHTEQEKPSTVNRDNSRVNKSAKEHHIRLRKCSRKTYKLEKLRFKKKKAAKEKESSIREHIENPTNEVSLVKQCRPNIFINSKKVAAVENIKLLTFAETVQTDKPCFVSIMVPCSTVRRFYMSIPVAFALEYLPRTSSKAILQLPDNSKVWEVLCYVRGRAVGLSTGWKEFALENKLKIGDICLFEMVETWKSMLMTVHIKRVQDVILL